MIQNTNDVYKLIKSRAYSAVYKPVEPIISNHTTHNLFNVVMPADRIRIDIYDTYMEIYKSKNMNTEYYEHIITTNQRGQKTLKRFKDLLFNKNLVAMVQYVNSL